MPARRQESQLQLSIVNISNSACNNDDPSDCRIPRQLALLAEERADLLSQILRQLSCGGLRGKLIRNFRHCLLDEPFLDDPAGVFLDHIIIRDELGIDIALISTKGMSVTASRMLLDRLTPCVENIFALHDFDISGFSIAGTLGTDSRRYLFESKPPIVDIGLRLTHVEKMTL